MSGKTPINRLEVWPLSFHLCKEEQESWRKQNSVAETAVSSSSFVAITASVHATLYFTFIYTFKLTEHAERA